MSSASDFWWSTYRDRIIAWIAFGPRHDECMQIERRLCIAEAQARARATFNPQLSRGLKTELWWLRNQADRELERLFDELWKPPFPIVFYGGGASRHCKRANE